MTTRYDLDYALLINAGLHPDEAARIASEAAVGRKISNPETVTELRFWQQENLMILARALSEA